MKSLYNTKKLTAIKNEQAYRKMCNHAKYKSHRLCIGIDDKGRKFLSVFLRVWK